MSDKQWRFREDYYPLLKKAKRLFPLFLSHIKRKRIFLCSFVAKRSHFVAQVHSIRPPLSLACSHDFLIQFHSNRFDKGSEAFKLYCMTHELFHIAPGAFDPKSDSYRKLVKHDTEDFGWMLSRYGLHLEKVDDILKGENALRTSKDGHMRFPRLEERVD